VKLEFWGKKSVFLRHLPFLPKMQKGLFVLFVHHAKQKTNNLIKIFKNAAFLPKSRNKMTIDLPCFFIYNYYGVI